MKLKTINLIFLKLFSLFIILNVFTFIYLTRNIFNDTTKLILVFIIGFSPFIFYKTFVKIFSKNIIVDFNENLVRIKSLRSNKDISKFEFSDINSYSISIPSSYVTTNDFIKISFQLKNGKLTLTFVNKTIPKESMSGENFIDKINEFIKEYNDLSSQKINLKESFFASNNGKILLQINLFILISIVLFSFEKNNLKFSYPIILTLTGSCLSILSTRKKEKELYQKYNC